MDITELSMAVIGAIITVDLILKFNNSKQIRGTFLT